MGWRSTKIAEKLVDYVKTPPTLNLLLTGGFYSMGD